MRPLSILWFGLSLVLVIAAEAFGRASIINGEELDPNKLPQVGIIDTNNARCSGVLVGPRAVLTANHCIPDGSKTTEFVSAGKTYTATPHKNSPAETASDLALIILEEAIEVEPFHVGKGGGIGAEVQMAGYGCADPGGGTPGTLRLGKSAITEITEEDLITKGNATLCFGDSGGPAWITKGVTPIVLGVGSKGNIKDTSYFTRLDNRSSVTFLKTTAEELDVEICGVNSDC